MATTTVLSILSDTTLPTRVFREEILASLISIYLLLSLCSSGLLLADNGLDSGNVTLDLSDFHGVVQLIGGVLHTQEEQVLLQADQLLAELGLAHLTDLTCLHLYSPTS